MRRKLMTVFVMLFLALSFVCSYSSADAELYASGMAWYKAHLGNFPDYFCGAWVNPGNGNVINISLTDRIKENEILAEIRDKNSVVFSEGKYCYNDLRKVCDDILNSICNSMTDGIVFVGVSDRNNCVHIGLSDTLSNEECTRVVENLKRKYGDCLSFAYGVATSRVADECQSGTETMKPLLSASKGYVVVNTEKMNGEDQLQESSRAIWNCAVIASVLLAIVAIVWRTGKKPSREFQLVEGEQLGSRVHLTRQDVIDVMERNRPEMSKDTKAEMLRKLIDKM